MAAHLLDTHAIHQLGRIEMKKIFAVMSVMACLLLGHAAPAGVIYRWVDLAPDPEAGRIDAYLEFGYEVWNLGGTFTSTPRDNNPDTLEPYTGLERLHFDLIDGVIDPIDWTTDLTCATYSGPRSCPADLSPDTRIVTLGSFDSWAFDLTWGERLSGSIAVNDGFSDFRMESLGSLFTITRLGSDLGPTCFFPGVCDGGTGYFQLDASTVPRTNVPEPAIWGLLLVGFAVLRLQRRR
jgi:hypothetical protein